MLIEDNIPYELAGFKDPEYEGALIGKCLSGGYIGYAIYNGSKRWVGYDSVGKCYEMFFDNTDVNSKLVELEMYDLEVCVNKAPLEYAYSGNIKEVYDTKDGIVLGCIFFRSSLKVGDTIKIFRGDVIVDIRTIKCIRRFNDVLDTVPVDLECGITLDDNESDVKTTLDITVNDMISEKIDPTYLFGKITDVKIYKTEKMKLNTK